MEPGVKASKPMTTVYCIKNAQTKKISTKSPVEAEAKCKKAMNLLSKELWQKARATKKIEMGGAVKSK